MSDIESVKSASAKSKSKYVDNNVITMRKKGLKINRWGEKKIINIDYNIYGTGLYGNIRNAVTGERLKHKVGSDDEHLYFKIIMTSGPKVLTLFYNSPAEYELHQQKSFLLNPEDPTSVDPKWNDITTAWRYKRDRYLN
jgi:hypothetical protein